MHNGRVDAFPQLRAYILQNASETISRTEMLQMAQRDIDPGVTAGMVRRIYRLENPPARSGLRWNMIVPDDKIEEFIKLIPGRSSAEIQKLAKETLGLDLTLSQIRGWKKNHKTASGYDTRFRAGRISETKGKTWDEFMSPEAQERSRQTQFHKGNIPKNRKTIGEVFLRSDGYLWIKIQDGHLNGNWQQYHRYLWEQAHGKIPDGYRIIFLDGNPRNCQLENLELVSGAVAATANKQFGFSKDPEINSVILKAAELKLATTKAEGRRKG